MVSTTEEPFGHLKKEWLTVKSINYGYRTYCVCVCVCVL